MPPKKRTRLSSSLEVPAPHSPASDGMQLDVTSVDASKDEIHDGVSIPDSLSHWTTDEETVLFKGMIRWKPVGMHKHFRMLSLSNYMRNNGFSKHHTRAAGIWEKLNVLYNLATLDEREDALEDLEADENDTDDLYVPFKLPEKDYKDLQHAARLETRRASSPPQLVYDTTVTPNKGRSRQTRQSTTEDASNTNVDSSPANPSERERSSRAGNARSRARGTVKNGVAESSTRGGRRSQRGVQPKQPATKSKQTEKQAEGDNDDAEEESQNEAEAEEASEEETSPKPEENDEGNDSEEENEDDQETEEEPKDDNKPAKAGGRRGSARAAVRTRGSARGRAQTNARSRGGGATRAKGRSGRQKRS